MLRILGIFFSLVVVFSQAKADVVDVVAPTGLSNGQTFRIMVVTRGTTTATSTDINDYNTFVRGQTMVDSASTTQYRFGGVTLNFNAWGSTATVGARDNIGWVEANQVGVYQANGDLISTSARFLTDSHNSLVSGNFAFVWTGSLSNGLANASNGLGTSNVLYGNTQAGNSAWTDAGANSNSISQQMYAISDVITVPEPSTYILCGMSTAFLAAMMYFQMRRKQRERLSFIAASAE